MSPFIVLLLATILVIVMITRLRFHPFIALMISSVFVGLMAIDALPSSGALDPLVTAVELPMLEFGQTTGKIAWVIALAALIGTAMMESGAAERIVNWLLHVFGDRYAATALMISGFILSIPVFFDTVFFLLIPLGITLARKTGKDYLLYITSIAGGAVIAHSIVPPTPGPLIMAETLQLDLGVAIMGGIVAGIIPAAGVILIGRRLNRLKEIPIRVAMGESSSGVEGPSLLMSLLPVVVPIVMISLSSIVQLVSADLPGWVAFQGNKNVAMSVGAIIALTLWARKRQLHPAQLWEAMNKPLEIAGIIILITSAGGAFGAMIKHMGIGLAIEELTAGFEVNYILLAWLIASVMKIAQGSGTVAMITASAIVSGILGDDINLPYHPIYLFLSMGFGSLVVSWMNDSGFWVVVKMSGMTEKEGLQSWSFMLAALGVLGLLQLLILSQILPLI